MCAIHLPLLFIGKASHESTKYSIYITTENVLVRYDSYLPKTTFFSLQLTFLFAILMFIIFAKSFTFKRVIHNVLLKFDVKKNLFCKNLHFSRYIQIAQSNQNN